jgi:mRNA interferase MazF
VALGAGRLGEIGKTRPAVVVSVDSLQSGTDYDLITVIPFTASPRRPASPVTPAVRSIDGLAKESVALCVSPVAAVPSRFLRRLGRLPDEDFAKVIAARALVEGWPGRGIG